MQKVVLRNRFQLRFLESLDNLLNFLNDIRLNQFIELTGKQEKQKVIYRMEEMSKQHEALVQALDLS